MMERSPLPRAHRRWNAGLAALILLAACASGPERGSDAPRKGDWDFVKQRARYEASTLLEEEGGASVALAIATADHIVWETGIGHASREDRIEATEHTVYRCGSVSKVFVALAAMQLVEDGLLDLDAPLSRYLPDFTIGPPATVDFPTWEGPDAITIRSVLTHHSGLPGDRFEGMFSARPYRYDAYARLLASDNAAAPAGHIYAYSNLGMTLLGHVIANVAGEPFEDFVQRRILTPLGMTRSSFLLEPRTRPHLAEAYDKGERQDQLPIGESPAGALYSTAHDLARFGQAMLRMARGEMERPLVSPESVAEMWRPQNEGVVMDLGTPIGLAWHMQDLPGAGRVMSHGGATVFFRSHLVISPALDVVAVALTNSAQIGPSTLANRMTQLAAEAVTGEATPEPGPIPDDGESFTAVELAALAGHYQTALGAIELSVDDDELAFEVFDQPFRLEQTDRRTFRLYVKLFGLFSIRPDALERLELTFRELSPSTSRPVFAMVAESPEGTELFGTRFAPPPLSDAWRARLGPYRFVNAQGDHAFVREPSLEEKDGMLVLGLSADGAPGRVYTALVPVSDERLVVIGHGRNLGVPLRVVHDDEGERLLWSGYELVRDQPAAREPSSRLSVSLLRAAEARFR